MKRERLARTKTAYRSLFNEEAPSDLWSYLAPGDTSVLKNIEFSDSSDDEEPRDTSILVRTGTGKTRRIFINLTDTVGYLKMKIQETEGNPPNVQRIYFDGRHLEDDDLLSDWNVTDGSVIDMYLPLEAC